MNILDWYRDQKGDKKDCARVVNISAQPNHRLENPFLKIHSCAQSTLSPKFLPTACPLTGSNDSVVGYCRFAKRIMRQLMLEGVLEDECPFLSLCGLVSLLK